MPALRVLLALFALVVLSRPALAQPPAWQPLVADLLKSEKPGYGGLCGIVIDHATGTIYINLSDKGIYRSTDQGKSFQLMTAKALKGRTEWPGCMQLDPTGKSQTMMAALVYGAP